MHHQGLMLLAILSDVFQTKAPGQREVKLHGRELPLASDGVGELDVDFRPVEGRFVRNDLIFQPARLDGFLERSLGQRPLIGGAIGFFTPAAVPSRQIYHTGNLSKSLANSLCEVDASD